MNVRHASWVALAVLLVMGGAGMAQSPNELFTTAEGYYDELTWDRAAEGFEAFIAAAPNDPRVPEAGYKRLVALQRLGRTSDLDSQIKTFAADNRGNVWGARARWLRATQLEQTNRWANYETIANERENAIRDYRNAVGRRPLTEAELTELSEWRLVLAQFYADWWEDRAPQLGLDTAQTVLDSPASSEHKAQGRLIQANIYVNRLDKLDRAEELLRTIVHHQADTTPADDAWLALANIAERRQDWRLARTRYLELRRRYPNSEFEAQAEQQIAAIERAWVNVNLSRTHLPGHSIPYTLTARNVSNVQFAAYRIDPARLTPTNRRDMGNLEPLLTGAQRVSAWGHAVPDKGNFEFHELSGLVPVREIGVYVVEAKVEGKPELRQLTLLNISSLVLVQNVAARRLVNYVADRLTEKPVAGVDLAVYQYDNDEKNTLVAEGRTNADGLFDTELKSPTDSGWSAWTVGSKDGQYVLLERGFWYWYQEPGQQLKAYVYTDRPVYRPENTVKFKAILRYEKEGLFTNLDGQQAEVTINDPRGGEAYKQTLTADEYGSLEGELELGADPTLGMYSIQVTVGDQAGSGQFRVEEYRKPEFEVTVGKPMAEVRPGQGVAVPVTARYYFGAPVTDGEVKYVVTRRPFYQYYWWRDPYDWFYAGWRGQSYGGWWPGVGSETVVTEGTIRTDSQGEAVIEFVTEKDSENDYTYSINVEVADPSRRVVEGSGSFTVTRRAFFLYGHTGQAHYKPTDKVTLTVHAQNADEQPVETPVRVRLWSMKWRKEVKDPKTGNITLQAGWVRDQAQWARDVVTDPDSGERDVVFDAPAEGQWELEMKAPDTFNPGEEITATTTFWVAADAYKGANYDNANLTILPERDLYEKGQTARILINSPVRDGALWLTIGAEHIYETRVVRYTGNALVLELPIADNYSPNVYVKGVVVGRKQIHFADAELKVPPTDRFLNVEVTSDAEEYKPRTTGTFDIKVTDHQGRPVAAQVSVGITDDSVYAIQPELASPIATFFHAGRRGNYMRHASSFEGWGEYGQELAFDGGYGGMGYGGGMGGMPGAGGMVRRSMAPGAPAAAPMSMEAATMAAADGLPKQAGVEGPEPVVRDYFPDTIVWLPAVTTDEDGTATVKVDFPDSLTTWRTTARAITKTTTAGQQVEQVTTSKDLIARLQAPRFFTQLDRSTISVLANNQTDQPQEVAVQLQVTGLELVGAPTATLQVPPNGVARLDREVRAVNSGEAEIVASVRGATDSDALRTKFDVLPHGADKFAAAAGQVTDGELRFALELPTARRADSTALKVHLEPTVVNALVDALPYLADYPYGCVEQTVSRFLPAVMVARTLDLLGTVDSQGRPVQAPDSWTNKGLDKLPDMVRDGVQKLLAMQADDGGFGWFSGMRSDVWMTSYVVYGLVQAHRADFAADQAALRRAVDFLYANLHLLQSQDDSSAYVAWVLGQTTDIAHLQPSAEQQQRLDETVERVWDRRDNLNDYTRALLILTLAGRGDDQRAQVVWRNLQARRIETEHGNHWGQNRWGWRWSEDQVETTAFALLAALAVEPDAELAAKTAQWLLLNRTGNRWYSTKDTAAAILALSTYADQHDQLSGEYTVKVSVNGTEVQGFEITPANVLNADTEVEIDPALLRDGNNEIVVTATDGGRPYASAMLTYYTLEDPITGAANLMAAERKYYRVIDYTDDKNERQTRREELLPGMSIASGEQIEVEVTIEAENDFSYVAFRDPKPAGCEPVDQLSGGTWSGAYMYRELHDEEVTFFADQLQQGTTTITYRLRAETPGVFRALPHNGFAMYRPDVRTLSDEAIITVAERPAAE
ncbi:MAG TPA: hypothetical protein DCZ72_13980 [Armatimonadetes bacterium]|nr:hypothetical protein [Armatimonadota bacterium]